MFQHLAGLTLMAMLLGGCSGEEEPIPEDTDTQIGECGEPAYGLEATITGLVQDATGAPVEGAEVRLEEWNWEPGTVHGTATTDVNGAFTMAATELVDVPGCWGTALDYHVVADFGELTGDAIANQKLYNALIDGSGVADFSSVPIVVE